MPFHAAVKIIRSLSGARISETAARRETLASGQALVAVEGLAVDLLEEEAPIAASAPAWLQMSVDGAMVPLVGGEWAEARSLALAELHCDGGALKADALSYFSRMTEHATFTRLATIETHRRGVERATTVLAVNDGAEWIQEYIDLQRADAVRILDWAHASEYVHAAGHAAFAEGCGAWCDAQIGVLKRGDPVEVLVELARLGDTLGPDDPAHVTVTQSLTYLAKRIDQIQYAAFTQLGYPIGSGIVESANRSVVQARLKGAGMHWAVSSVNPLLALRSAICSDRWAEAWPAIAAHRRNAHRLRRITRHQQRVACLQSDPQQPKPPRPPRMVNGRPTKEHPYKRYPAVNPRRAKI